MSYPRRIHTLIVEDELVARKNYAHMFEVLSSKFDLAPPCIVPSYNDAQECLASLEPFHLVVLDLQLPWAAREVADQGTKSGLSLVKQAAERDRFPVPALLVISGQLAETRYGLSDQLRNDFWYGRTVNKSVDEEEAIVEALIQCQRYTDVGIHLETEDNDAVYPPLSPREEDMLRRCVLAQSQCLGVVLSWWSAQRHRNGVGGQAWTKVLQGKFLLDGGLGYSRPIFLKFTVSDYADNTHRDNLLLASKLGHIKVIDHRITLHQALLVTEKVGEGASRPISLVTYLQRTETAVTALLPSIVHDVATQLSALGRSTPDEKHVAELLWPYHDRVRIADAWKRFGNSMTVTHGNAPLNLFDELVINQQLIWVNVQNCTHGDLNVTNVALDEGTHGIRGYIFDAAGMQAAPSVRDFAALEVTALLHLPLAPGQTGAPGDSLVDRCSVLYEALSPQPEQIAVSDFVASNIMSLVTAVRQEAFERCDPFVYALLVFDQVLLQLSGLTYGLSGNKITVPEEAARLVAKTADWVQTFVPFVATQDKNVSI